MPDFADFPFGAKQAAKRDLDRMQKFIARFGARSGR
jgi:hypothetical protein